MSVCPSCGYCPCCGRSTQQPYQYQYPVQLPYIWSGSTSNLVGQAGQQATINPLNQASYSNGACCSGQSQ